MIYVCVGGDDYHYGLPEVAFEDAEEAKKFCAERPGGYFSCSEIAQAALIKRSRGLSAMSAKARLRPSLST